MNSDVEEKHEASQHSMMIVLSRFELKTNVQLAHEDSTLRSLTSNVSS